MSDAFDDDQSMASWAREDDVDLQAAAIVGSKLSEIDGILFNEIAMRSDDVDKHIMAECTEWKARYAWADRTRSVLMFTPIRFPYLRLVGQQIAPSINDGVVVRLSPHQ